MRTLEYPQWDELHDPDVVDWKRVRSAIEHENNLTHQRFSWLLTSQGFLASGFFLIWQASLTPLSSPDKQLKLQWILGIIVVTALLISIHLTLGLQAAREQHRRLEQWWNDRQKPTDRHPPICGSDPKLVRTLPYYYLSVLFFLVWIVLGILVFFDVIAPHKGTVTNILIAAACTLLGFVIGRIIPRRKSVNSERTAGKRSG